MTASSNEQISHRGRPANQSAAASFDDLPDSAHVRVRTVADLFATSESNVWRWVKGGRIPAPVKLGPQTTAWRVGEIRRALNATLSAA